MSWGYVAIAAGTVISGSLANQGAEDAADASQQGAETAAGATRYAADRQVNEIGRQFDYIQNINAPQIASGYGATNRINQLMGIAPDNTAVNQAKMNSLKRQLESLSNLDDKIYDNMGSTERDRAEAAIRGQMDEIRMAGQQEQRQPVGANFMRDQYGFVDPNADNRQLTGDTFQTDPGYQFSVDEGLKAIDARRNANGMRLGGAAVKEAMRYGTNMADQQYGNWINRRQFDIGRRDQNYQNYMSRLYQSAGMGTGAVNNVTGAAGNAGAQTGAAFGNQGNYLANIYQNNAANQGNIAMGRAGNMNEAIQGGFSNALYYGMRRQ